MDWETAIVSGGTLGALVGTIGLVWSAGARPSVGRAVLVGALVAWWLAVIGAARHGFFQVTRADSFPKLLLGWIPALALGAIWWGSPAVQKLSNRIPLSALVGVQVFRLVGLAMVWSTVLGRLPPLFGWVAGMGGVLVGASAPWVARGLARGLPSAMVRARFWNLLGLGDILLAMVLGGMSGPGPHQVLSLDFPSAAATAFPLVVTPAFLVPLALLGHFLVWQRLRPGAQALD